MPARKWVRQPLCSHDLTSALIAVFLKCILRVEAVLVIAALSNIRCFNIAGLVRLFPTFALIALRIMGAERTMADRHTAALFVV